MPSGSASAFPSTRPERESSIVQAQQAAAIGGGTPVVRLWPIHILEQAGVGVVVSESMTGPAVIDEMVLEMPTASNLPFETISVYVAEDPSGQGSNFALNTVPSGTRIFDNLSFTRDDANTSTDNRGFNPFNMNEANIGFMRFPLKYPVLLANFFVKVRVQNTAAAAGALHGYMRVVTQVPPDQIGNFL